LHATTTIVGKKKDRDPAGGNGTKLRKAAWAKVSHDVGKTENAKPDPCSNHCPEKGPRIDLNVDHPGITFSTFISTLAIACDSLHLSLLFDYL